MTRSIASIAALLSLLLCAALALAAPSTASFDALRADLVQRRDQDYTGGLSRTQVKELAAITSCLARIDGPHASVADDAKSFKAVAKKLVKAFRGQFTGETPGTLPGLLAGTATALLAEAEGAFGALQAAIDAAVDPARRAQASELAADARAALDEAARPETPQATAAALIIRAAKFIGRAVDLANYRPDAGVRCKIGSRQFVATTVSATIYDRGDGTYLVGIQARGTHPVTGATESVDFSLSGEPGDLIEIGAFTFPFQNVCSYNPDGAPESVFFSQFSPLSFARITSVDTATGSASGTFAAFLMRNGNERLTIKKGTFNVTGATVLGP